MHYKRVYVEITDVCNLACDFCPGTARPPRFMSPDEFDRIAERLDGLTDEIYLHVMGEPLLHPRLGELLDVCERRGLPVKLTTNGTLLSEKGAMLFGRKTLRQVNVSLHCYSGNAMEKPYERYCAEVFEFARKLRESSPDCVLMLRLWNGGAGEAAQKQRAQTAEIVLRTFSVDITQPTPHANGHRLGHRYWIQTAERFDWPSETAPDHGETGFCQGLRTHCGVLCDGSVVPCCLDAQGTMTLGNLLRQPAEEILNGEAARGIYDGFSQGRAVHPLCRHCGYRTRFR